MSKKHIIGTLACGLALCLVAGCGILTPENIARIHRTVATALELAYESGGKDLAVARIDELVAEGKITPEQSVMLKQAVQKSYEAFLVRLNELAEPAE